MTIPIRLTRPDPSEPWGFRMKGGVNCSQPLTVSYVVPGGLADCGGLQTGDQIVSIGGDCVDCMTHQQAQQAIIRCCNDLDLEIRGHTCQGYSSSLSSPSQPSYSVIHGPPASHSTVNIELNRPCSSSQLASPPCLQKSPKSPRESINVTYKPLTSSGVKPTIVRESEVSCTPTPPCTQRTPPSFRPWQIPKPGSVAIEKVRCDANAMFSEGPSSPSCSSSFPCSQTNSCSSKDTHLKRGILRTDCSKQRPVCNACTQEIHGPYIDTMDHCYCPCHFKCSICCTPLNERSFAEHDGKLFCEADFAKFIAPKCAKCCQPIIGQMTKALNKDWHPHCFTCFCCGKPLKDKFYVEEREQVLCEADWKKTHTFQCCRCNHPISEIDRFIEAFGKHFHAHCFCCAACQTPLEGKPFHARDNKPFCRVHAHSVALYG